MALGREVAPGVPDASGAAVVEVGAGAGVPVAAAVVVVVVPDGERSRPPEEAGHGEAPT